MACTAGVLGHGSTLSDELYGVFGETCFDICGILGKLFGGRWEPGVSFRISVGSLVVPVRDLRVGL